MTRKYNKIYYRHGTMYSGKTVDLIRNYTTDVRDNKHPIAIKPSTDVRDEDISSRLVETTIPCYRIKPNESLLVKFLLATIPFGYSLDNCMLFIDEVQFLTPAQIQELHEISAYCPIMCYGLKRSYTGDIFPSIVKLESLAEDVAEIKSTCSFCNSKATHNLLVRNGVPTYSGDMVNVEGVNNDDKYYKVCREHFYEPPIDLLK